MISHSNKRMIITIAVMVILAVCGVVFIGSGPVDAQSADIAGSTGRTDGNTTLGVSLMPTILKMVSALVLVVLCIYLFVFLLKKTLGSRYTSRSSSHSLEVIESTFVAPKKSIALVRVADKAVMIGITDQQINVLTELTEEQTADILTEPAEIPRADSFKSFLSNAADLAKGLGSIRKSRLAAKA